MEWEEMGGDFLILKNSLSFLLSYILPNDPFYHPNTSIPWNMKALKADIVTFSYIRVEVIFRITK